jgi:hypothetical protein
MRNYLNLLGLRRKSSAAERQIALNSLPPEEQDLEEDMRAVLNGETERTHYDRVHLQYEAMAAAQQRMQGQEFQDTNQWSRRLVEFPVQEDSLY